MSHPNSTPLPGQAEKNLQQSVFTNDIYFAPLQQRQFACGHGVCLNHQHRYSGAMTRPIWYSAIRH
jgi:hypothetical protein